MNTTYHPDALRAKIRSVLDRFRPYVGPANPIELLLGTCTQETHLGALGRRQLIKKGGKLVPEGRARGIFQMEPATFDDCWKRGIEAKPDFRLAVLKAWPDASLGLLEVNDDFAILMARMKYRLIRVPLPPDDDLFACAYYYKMWYNTPRGGSSIEKYMNNYKRLCV